MTRTATFAVLACFVALLLPAMPAAAQTAGQGAEFQLAQTQTSPQIWPRTRLRVRPLYPRQPFHSLYPPPYDVRYPGPNARRECVARYVQEHRPSGTVVTPRMRCWWVRG
jgi:hypothetical protein